MYELTFKRRARRNVARLPESVYGRMIQAIDELAENPRPRNSRKLRGKEGWRIRIGDYRAIYEIDDEAREVLVLDIGHRRDIYR
ncbi:MAG: type II toxin-antitoxin system RelE/ParE family toxin [Rubrobacter sp.]|nr:type II toxin-antitoxin system RelE/ParE family toxin [Rubrobacter sp.]